MSKINKSFVPLRKYKNPWLKDNKILRAKANYSNFTEDLYYFLCNIRAFY